MGEMGGAPAHAQPVAATAHPLRPLSRAMPSKFLKWNSVADGVTLDTLKASQGHQGQRGAFKRATKIVQYRRLPLKRDMPKSLWRNGQRPSAGILPALRRRSFARATSICISQARAAPEPSAAPNDRAAEDHHELVLYPEMEVTGTLFGEDDAGVEGLSAACLSRL